MSEIEDKLNAEIKAELEKLEAREKPAEEKEEVKATETPETHSETVDQTTDPFLEEAIKMGYDPNHKGPNKKTPEQFVKDGSFFKKIDAQKKEIDELKRLFKESADRSLKIEQATRERVIHELQEKKMQAVSEGDIEKYEQAEKEQQKVREEIAPVAKPLQDTPQTPVEIKEFTERNSSWFNLQTPENELMAKAADGLCSVVAEEARLAGENLTMSEQLRRVEEKIKVLFPKRFENLNKEKPASVATSTVASGETTKGLASRLTQRQKDFIRSAKAYGSKLTEEQYAKQLQLTGELRDE
jgi:hypothetical protein